MEGQQRGWEFVAYGTSVDLERNGFRGSVETEDLEVWSLGGKGKLVPASTDGLAFYYTKLEAARENFTLTADVCVEQWTFSNGQDGFGLMAADAVGSHGDDATFWNNSYMASVTRVEYKYDPAAGALSDRGVSYSMKLGVCAQEKKGITPLSIREGTQVGHFASAMRTLETSAARQGLEPGVYNIVGAYTNPPEKMRDIARLTRFRLSIRRMNDGYLLGYTNEQGETAQWKYYHDEEGDALTKLDSKFIYVGFFASRNAKIHVENVKLDIISPKEDDAPAPRPTALITPYCDILSADVANREEYVLTAYGNAEGMLKVFREGKPEGKDGAEGAVFAEGRADVGRGGGALVAEASMGAKMKSCLAVKLRKGLNRFLIEFIPREGYCPSAYEALRSFEPITFPFTVSYAVHEGEKVYISPEGSASAAGSREEPMDLYTAVRGAIPGQQLILMGGRYAMEKELVIERGMNGMPGKPVRMTAEEGCRPVLDFLGKAEGLAITADYWICSGFDVTNTAASVRGIHLAGSHNVLEGIYVYRNGSTGLQISCYRGSDTKEEWPHDNLVRNCTAYLNADPGYTDADGFAAKITVGEGNVFDGCISAYNADDGFDLFAKVERGATGSVLIRNCLAFRNGYVLDEEGKEIHVGLGNGFKLGGSSIPCGHRLKDSIAFANGEKGVDANSSPNAMVENVISYNNDSYNVGLYTTDAVNTSFYVRDVLSVRTEGNLPDKLETRGTQNMGDIYHESNYYFDGKKSVNVKGEEGDISRFKDMDIQKAIHGGIHRGDDGSICRNGFLE